MEGVMFSGYNVAVNLQSPALENKFMVSKTIDYGTEVSVLLNTVGSGCDDTQYIIAGVDETLAHAIFTAVTTASREDYVHSIKFMDYTVKFKVMDLLPDWTLTEIHKIALPAILDNTRNYYGDFKVILVQGHWREYCHLINTIERYAI